MKKIISVFGLAISLVSYGQNEEDVLRYSYQQLSGTPRSLGMGGSMGALGADLSAIHSNPAGLAMYRSNYYLAGIGFQNWKTESSYIAQGGLDRNQNFNIPNLGIVFTQLSMEKGKQATSGIVNVQVAFSMNRTNNFNQHFRFSALNESSSILDYFGERAYGYTTSELSSDLQSVPGQAWNTYLINEDPNNPNTYYANLPNQITMLQDAVVTRSGRQQDFNAAFALNISHRLYLGMSMRLNTLKFSETFHWEEATVDQSIAKQSMSYEFKYNTQGSGYSARLGALFRINDFLRLGLAWQSPVTYQLNDEYSSSMSSNNFNPGQSYSYQSDPGQFNYNLRIPGRVDGNIAVILPKIASLSFDLEQVRHQDGRLSSPQYGFGPENTQVSALLKTAYNYRIGAEFLAGPLRYRIGYARYENPLKSDYSANLNLDTYYYTAGLGYLGRSGFYCDAALVLQQNQSLFTPYTLAPGGRTYYSAVNKNLATRVVLGIGARF